MRAHHVWLEHRARTNSVSDRFRTSPWIRSADNENYATVARVLDGERTGVRELSQGVGTLILFRGRHSLHRVTPVAGSQPRLVAVLSYDTEPGAMLSEHNRMLFYGRVA